MVNITYYICEQCKLYFDDAPHKKVLCTKCHNKTEELVFVEATPSQISNTNIQKRTKKRLGL